MARSTSSAGVGKPARAHARRCSRSATLDLDYGVSGFGPARQLARPHPVRRRRHDRESAPARSSRTDDRSNERDDARERGAGETRCALGSGPGSTAREAASVSGLGSGPRKRTAERADRSAAGRSAGAPFSRTRTPAARTARSRRTTPLLADFVRSGHPTLFVLGGAGCSTASGLGDYRDRNGQWKRRQPITGQTFPRRPAGARPLLGRGAPSAGRRSVHARPGAAHHALAALQRSGHVARPRHPERRRPAPARPATRACVELHGTLATVSCVRCAHTRRARGLPARAARGEPLARRARRGDYAPGRRRRPRARLAGRGGRVPDCPRCGGPAEAGRGVLRRERAEGDRRVRAWRTVALAPMPCSSPAPR